MPICTIIRTPPRDFKRSRGLFQRAEIVPFIENRGWRLVHTFEDPVILPEEYHDAWLSGEAGKEVLIPYPADRMRAWPVSPRVNSPKNNDAEIIAPIELNTGRDLVSDPRGGTLL